LQRVGGSGDPRVAAIGAAALDAPLQGLDLLWGLGGVDPSQPVASGRKRPFAGRRQPLGQRADDAFGKSGPFPCFGSLRQAGAQWVSLDIAKHREQVLVALDREAFETALIQWPGTRRVVVGVPALCVRDGDEPEELRELSIFRRPQHHVPMIGHQAIAQQPHRQPLMHMGQHLLEGQVVGILQKDRVAGDGPVQHVIRITAGVDAKPAGHGQSECRRIAALSNKDSRPLCVFLIQIVRYAEAQTGSKSIF